MGLVIIYHGQILGFEKVRLVYLVTSTPIPIQKENQMVKLIERSLM